MLPRNRFARVRHRAELAVKVDTPASVKLPTVLAPSVTAPRGGQFARLPRPRAIHPANPATPTLATIEASDTQRILPASDLSPILFRLRSKGIFSRDPAEQEAAFGELYQLLHTAQTEDTIGPVGDMQQVSRIKSFGGGGLNSGIHLVKIAGVREAKVLRFESDQEPTRSQIEAQEAIVGNRLFAQIERTQSFVGLDGKRMMVQIMEAGGASLAADRGRPIYLSKKDFRNIIEICDFLNQHEFLNADVKAQNLVKRIDGGVMVVDHGGMRRIPMRDREPGPDSSVGPITVLPPESFKSDGIVRPIDLFKRQVRSTHGLIAANDWLHGQAIYQALTGHMINNWKRPKPYPLSIELAINLREIIEALAKDPTRDYSWVSDYEYDIITLLHPDPKKRAKTRDILKRLKADELREGP